MESSTAAVVVGAGVGVWATGGGSVAAITAVGASSAAGVASSFGGALRMKNAPTAAIPATSAHAASAKTTLVLDDLPSDTPAVSAVCVGWGSVETTRGAEGESGGGMREYGAGGGIEPTTRVGAS